MLKYNILNKQFSCKIYKRGTKIENTFKGNKKTKRAYAPPTGKIIGREPNAD